LAWEKLSNASIDVGGDESSGEYPDGQPRARHTYDYIQYVPALDAFCTLGGQVMFPSGQKSTNKTHCFDFVAQKWVRKNLGAEGAIGGLSGVDESTGKVWEHSTGNSARLLEWDPQYHSQSHLRKCLLFSHAYFNDNRSEKDWFAKGDFEKGTDL